VPLVELQENPSNVSPDTAERGNLVLLTECPSLLIDRNYMQFVRYIGEVRSVDFQEDRSNASRDTAQKVFCYSSSLHF